MALKKDKVEEVIVEPVIVEEKKDALHFFTKYGKQFMVGVVAGILLFGGWYGYKKLMKEPNALKAEEAIFPAENLFGKMAATSFSKDSTNTLLNGGVLVTTAVKGLLKIVSENSGTAAANRANYMIGATYLQTKEFDKAIKYLKEFDANGAYQTDIKKNIMLGHAYAELKKTDDALASYKKATTINTKDEPFTADALVTAAAYAETLGKTKDAIELYQNLKENFPLTQPVQSGEVDKCLARLGITK
jgi:tetratricopeptide (TPR) repeat protein